MLLFQSTAKPVRPSSARRLRVAIFTIVFLCTFYWIASRTTTSVSRIRLDQENERKTASWVATNVNAASDRRAASLRWRLNNSNGGPRRLDSASQTPVLTQQAQAFTDVKPPTTVHHQKALVVASMIEDNTTWMYEALPDWHKSIYVVDDEAADLTVEDNKGRESMVYLSYIIDNYDHLPDHMLFIHSQRYQWHNDDPYYDGVPMIKQFQIPYLEKIGYVNLRCAWVLGCPDEIHPLTDTIDLESIHAGAYFMNGFKELFPGTKVPDTVAVSCCAQFGVARWKIHERPKGDYERYKRWLLETDLDDDMSGRIMEYSWHMIFGMDPVHCPDAGQCYCNVWGLCDLECSEDECQDRYALPPYSTLPEGWPHIGWNGKPQDPTQGGLPLLD